MISFRISGYGIAVVRILHDRMDPPAPLVTAVLPEKRRKDPFPGARLRSPPPAFGKLLFLFRGIPESRKKSRSFSTWNPNSFMPRAWANSIPFRVASSPMAHAMDMLFGAEKVRSQA